jgi:hypothetical protein
MIFPLPLSWAYLACVAITSQVSLWNTELHESRTLKTAFWVVSVKQQFMQTEFNIRPVLVRRRPKEVLLAWLVSVSQDQAHPPD